MPLDAIAPVLCAGITVYKGLKESGARAGQSVAIVGAGGGLGSLACQYAKAMGLVGLFGALSGPTRTFNGHRSREMSRDVTLIRRRRY